ncbi:MAG: hypothetical protein ABR521_01665 [Gaiellaceae bacterium]
MSSAARNRTMFFAAAVMWVLALAVPGAGLAADTQAGASEGSSAGAGADDGSVFCDPATLPEGAVCSLTPDKEGDEADPPTQAPAAEAGAERLPATAADLGEGEIGGDETTRDASATRSGDVGSVPLARTGLRVWPPAVLGACLLLGGVGLLVVAPRSRIDR